MNSSQHRVVLLHSVVLQVTLCRLDGASQRRQPSKWCGSICIALIVYSKGKKAGGIATLRDFNKEQESDDDDDPRKRENLYAGGERSWVISKL